MKTKIVTVISLAGVLVAGSAAALVNTQVLGGSSSPSADVVDAAPLPPETTPVLVEAPAGTTPMAPAAAVVESAQPAARVATQAVYAIGEAGTVTLDTAGDVLTIVSVTPADGWVVTKSEAQDAINVEVRFQAGSVEVEFHANLLFGVVTTSVDSHDSTQTATDNSGSNSGSTRHSGGDDDGAGGGNDD
jgi:hypothetical protein